jgi:hypothetical protein
MADDDIRPFGRTMGAARMASLFVTHRGECSSMHFRMLLAGVLTVMFLALVFGAGIQL